MFDDCHDERQFRDDAMGAAIVGATINEFAGRAAALVSAIVVSLALSACGPRDTSAADSTAIADDGESAEARPATRARGVTPSAVDGTPVDASPTDRDGWWKPFDHPGVLTRSFVGFTRPARRIVLTSEVQARVLRVLLESGQSVAADPDEAGAVVIEMDAELERRELATQQAELSVAKRQVELERVALTRAEKIRDRRQLALDRVRALESDASVSVSALDDAKIDFDVAVVDVDNAIARIDYADAVVARTAARVAAIEERVRRHRIRAPRGWVVEERIAEAGMFARPGDTLLQLVDVSELRVPFRLSEAELAALRRTEKLELLFIQAKVSVPVRVHRIGADYDPISRKRLVELAIDGALAERLLGESAGGIETRLDLAIPGVAGGFLIPRRFVTRNLDQYWVTSDAGGRYAVTLLDEDSDNYSVLPGELPQDVVLVPVKR